MKTTMIWALAALNVALLAGLAFQYLPTNYANAQAARPGEYLMIPVDFQGARSGVVVILDSSTRKMSALMTDENLKKTEAMPPIDLEQVFGANR